MQNSDRRPMVALKSGEEKLEEKQTPWISIWTTAIILVLVGLQISVYFTSTWQYMKMVDERATMELFGWVMAACSLGCAVANPLFGWWNQKTLSTKKPLTVGFALCGIGNLIYALLPLFPISSFQATILICRFLTGFGAGTLGVLRGFLATASTRKDRVRAVSLGTAGLTSGLSLGPALQICFLPLGATGYSIGPVLINMYTGAALFMFLVSVLTVVVVNVVLVEDYAGIISDEEKQEDQFLIIPKYDKIAVAVLFFFWWIMVGVAASEALAAPITMAMFNWSSEEAVFYNGIIQTIGCLTSTLNYAIIGSTRVGKCDRRLILCIGLLGFLAFHMIHLPWPFYPGPLDRPPNGSHADAGGCAWEYTWCDSTPRVPMYLYLFFASVVLGFAFPFISAPCNTLLSEVLGPRKQGFVQGLYAFWGSVSQFTVPIIASWMFEISGYGFIMLYHVVLLTAALLLLFLLRKRLVPLALTPALEKATRYKSGTFYRM